MEIVKVEWVDSHLWSGGWLDSDFFDDEDLIPLMISVGIIYKKTKDAIVLIGDTGKESVARGIAIPRVCIKKITKLEKIDGNPESHS